MTWWTGELKVDDRDLLAAAAELFERAPAVTRRAVDQAANRVGEQTLARLRREPGPVRRPIQWASERQRRAFFASNGFGRGIPTRRTQRLVNAWRLVVIYTPDQLTEVGFENDTPYRPYVTGRRQQPFHRITGWQSEESVFLDAAIAMTDAVETALIRSFYSVEG